MTTRRLVNLDDFVTEKTTYNRFGEKVTKTPLVRIADGGLLSNYKQLSTNAKYIKFTGMLEPNDGGEGMYIQDDTITDDEDLGVIIYIGEHKYRRLYAAWVNIDWFYIDDFGVALQRAIKYSSIRGTRGKIYECKTAITLNIIQQLVIGHGVNDYAHKLIDMRGATVNFTNEEAQYCFNIRIYHRDTKFMFTNCNFNVTNNNINLVNIANIIGVNSYTDMLTDNVYNVTKDKLPDTNRVVLVDEPEIEGIKTFDFNGQLQYIGDAISANDNQAVTKVYKPTDYDESLYVSLQDTRKLDGLTTFTNIFDRDQGNTILQGKINEYILENIRQNLLNIVTNYSPIVYKARMYYVGNLITNTISVKQNYIYNINVYKVLTNNIRLDCPPMLLLDESNIGRPMVLEVNLSASPINSSDLGKLEYIEDSVITGYELTSEDTAIVQYSYLLALKAPVSSFTINNVTYIVDDNKVYFPYIIVDYGEISTRWSTQSYHTLVMGALVLFRSNGVLYSSKAIFADRPAMRTHTTNLRVDGTVKFKFNIGDPYISISYSSENLSYNSAANNTLYSISTTPLVLNTKTRQSSDFTYMKVIDKISIASIEVSNNNYVAIEKPSIIVSQTSDINAIERVYITGIQLIQANLQVFDKYNETKPTVTIKLNLLVNNSIISCQTDLYIIRFISVGVPRFEYPASVRQLLTDTTGDNIKYPIYHLFSNVFPSMMIYNSNVIFELYDNSIYTPTYTFIGNSECARADKYSKCTCRCTSASSAVANYSLSRLVYIGDTKGSMDSKFSAGMTCSRDSYLRARFTSYNTAASIVGRDIMPNTPFIAYNIPILVSGTGDIVTYLPHNEYRIIKCYIHSTFNTDRYTAVNKPLSVYIRGGVSDAECAKGSLKFNTTITPATAYLFSCIPGLGKTEMFERLFGKYAMSFNKIVRDGILKDPFRHRTQLSEHQFAAPVGVLNP